jgi:hypothetical protein
MTGYKITLDDFARLVKGVSRHHRKGIAGLLSLTAHTRRGSVYFRNNNGTEVPLEEVYQRCQDDPQLQRTLYNLHMNSIHFG